MERIARITVAMFALVAVALPASAGGRDQKSDACRCSTVASLLAGIQSDNQGLRESAAFVLGEIKCTEAVIPLMRMLHEERSESARLAAALALTLIGDARGAYAVRRAVVFDESARVRLICAYFYNEYVHPQTFAFVSPEPAVTRAMPQTDMESERTAGGAGHPGRSGGPAWGAASRTWARWVYSICSRSGRHSRARSATAAMRLPDWYWRTCWAGRRRGRGVHPCLRCGFRSLKEYHSWRSANLRFK